MAALAPPKSGTEGSKSRAWRGECPLFFPVPSCANRGGSRRPVSVPGSGLGPSLGSCSCPCHSIYFTPLRDAVPKPPSPALLARRFRMLTCPLARSRPGSEPEQGSSCLPISLSRRRRHQTSWWMICRRLSAPRCLDFFFSLFLLPRTATRSKGIQSNC